MTPKILQFSGSTYDFDFLAILPEGMSLAEGLQRANAEIVAANAEDHASDDGCCADGLPVQESITRRLEAQGFIFMTDDNFAVTMTWDEYHGELSPA